MNKLLGTVVVVLLTAASVSAQSLVRTYTRPCVPPQEVLDRLNLKMDWRVYVPMDGYRDGFVSIQLLGDQILAQTRSGAVALLDAATGATLWRARPGQAYNSQFRLGYNRRSVFVLNDARLYALDRATGLPQWDFTLPNAPTAAPVADEEAIYLTLNSGRIYVYALPDLTARPAPPPPPPVPPTSIPTSMNLREAAAMASSPARAGRFYRAPDIGLQPRRLWDYPVGTDLTQPPLLTSTLITLAGADGSFFTTSKYINRVQYSFKSDAAVSAPMGQYGDTAYIGSQDYNLYAMDIPQGRILWRVLGGAPITRRPVVQDDEVYVTPEGAGLYRLDRNSGELLWRYPQIEYFLAANRKFVYGLDRQNLMHILDRERGILLSVVPGTRDYVFPISNELTDRIYLASNDGLIVSLHDRDYPAPLRTKNVGVKKEGPPPTGVEEKKETDKGEGAEEKK
jgi:hypothetical protein